MLLLLRSRLAGAGRLPPRVMFFRPAAEPINADHFAANYDHTPYRAPRFVPHFVQYMADFKFVYLRPR